MISSRIDGTSDLKTSTIIQLRSFNYPSNWCDKFVFVAPDYTASKLKQIFDSKVIPVFEVPPDAHTSWPLGLKCIARMDLLLLACRVLVLVLVRLAVGVSLPAVSVAPSLM